jgi:hypothetical protein
MIKQWRVFNIGFLSAFFLICFNPPLSSHESHHAPAVEKYLVKVKRTKQIDELIQKMDFIVDEQTTRDEVAFYANALGLKTLKARGIDYKLLQEQFATENDEKSLPGGGYHSYEEISGMLEAWQRKYPDLVQVKSIGKTIQGREIWAIKISDNASLEEKDEPAIRLVGTMHGNEIVGQEMMLRLIEDLLSHYQGQDETSSRALIDSTELWIIPNLNYDGSALVQRWNKNGVDLNRDFPDYHKGEEAGARVRQPETQSMMKFAGERQYALAANFHGGALVVNYPWDGLAVKFPEDALISSISLEYAKLNPPMYDSSEFLQGITNGYAWYSLRGGLQDWSYGLHGTMEVTIELNDTKWPPFSMIDELWKDNRDAIVKYIRQANTGVHAQVVASAGSAELKGEGWRYEISRPTEAHPFYTQKLLSTGNIHHPLLPGSYRLKILGPANVMKEIPFEIAKAGDEGGNTGTNPMPRLDLGKIVFFAE